MLRTNNPFFMWFFPLSFFTWQFILRLWPGLMMQPIMHQFAIDASHFGLLAALYYYGYAGMQIPVAMMLERYGPRLIVFIFALICGLATIVFSYTNNWYLACLCRFMVGAGSAVGFLGVSKVVSEWFSSAQYARMIGFSFSIGLLGAIYGGKPVSLLVNQYDWQSVAMVFGSVAILLGLGAYSCLRSPSVDYHPLQKQSGFTLLRFKTLLSSPLIWILALANALMVGSLEGFADVWGVPYLMTAHQIPKGEAAQLISCIFVGMLFGGPLLALICKKLGNYTVIALCGISMAAIFLLLLSMHKYHPYALAALFLLTGILCCYQVIVFSAGSELVDAQLLGVTVAFLNCLNMLGGSFFHTAIGYLMDYYWSSGLSSDGLKVYSLQSFEAALKIIPYCAMAGACFTLYVAFALKRQSTDRSFLLSKGTIRQELSETSLI